MKQVTRQQIEQCIKSCSFKWDKYAYSYAISALCPYSEFGLYPQGFKKNEIVERFYELALLPENFNKLIRIKTFSTLKTN